MKLSRLLEIECSVPDAARAQAAAATLFGSSAVGCELPVAVDPALRRSPGLRRVVLGETVIAFSEAPAGRTPRVECLRFATEDVASAIAEARSLGIESSPARPARWPSGATGSVAELQTREVLGFAVALVDGSPLPFRADAQALHPGFAATSALSPMFQVEPVVPSLERAGALIEGLFGGREVEERFAAALEKIAPAQRIQHFLLGDTVVQLIEMTAVLPGFSWSDLYTQEGPSVHNLTFMVPSIAAATDGFADSGMETLIAANLPWAEMIGAENVNTGSEAFCIAATRPLFGFHLELCEPFGKGVLGVLHRPVWGIG